MSARKKILAVASGGGHWIQLLRLRPAFEGHDVVFVTVQKAYEADVQGQRFRTVRDATRWDKLGLVQMAAQIAWILMIERPDVVISTGAAPGYMALRLARYVGAKTVWLDSIANVEELSMSGKMASGFVDLCLTQWEPLAEGRVKFEGAVL